MKKRVFSMLLAVVMLVGLLSTVALAEESTNVAFINETGYATLADAISAAGDDATITLAVGNHTMPGQVTSKNITIKGGVDAIVDLTASVNASGSTINFEGVTVKFDNDNYEGLQHSTKVTYTNCTHIGTEFLYAPTVSYSGCTFNMYNASTEYAVWTYGASDVTFTDCNFNTNGKAILVYTEAAHQAAITLSRCTFTSNGTYTGKAAVELGQSANGNVAEYDLVFTNCTADDNFSTNNSSSNLWGNKDSMTTEDGSSVVIDGSENLMPAPAVTTYVAQIGETMYETLQAALEDAVATSGSVTVELLSDISGDNWTSIAFNSYPSMAADSITLDGNSRTITGLTAPLIGSVWTGSSLTIQDLTISDANITVTNGNTAALIATADSISKITLINCSVVDSTISGSGYAGGLIGWCSGYAKADDGPVHLDVTIQGCSVTGCTITGGSSTGSLIGHAGSGANESVVITSSTIGSNTLTCTDENYGRADKVGAAIGRINNSVVTLDITDNGSNTLNPAGTYSDRILGAVAGGSMTISGGTYVSDPRNVEKTDSSTLTGTAPAIAEGYEIVENNDGTWTVEKIPVVASVKVGDAEAQEYTNLKAAFEAVSNLSNGSSSSPVNVTIEILADVTVNEDWEAYDITHHYGTVTINGNNHTISNLPEALVAAAHYTDWAINDLTISTALIDDPKSEDTNGLALGAFINHIQNDGSIIFTNCHVVDSKIDASGTADIDAAAFVGYSSSSDKITLTNCSVKNTTIGGDLVGAVVGYTSGGNIELADTTVSENTITGSGCAGTVVGRLNGPADAVINSGTIITGNGDVDVVGNVVNNNNELVLNGGAFDKKPTITSMYDDGAYMNGETIADSVIVADGYVVAQRADGMWTLAEDDDITPGSVTLTADKTSLRGGGTVTLTVSGVTEGMGVVICNDETIVPRHQEGGVWTAELPNTTKDYTFEVTGLGENTASVDVSVTYRSSSSGGGSGSSTYSISISSTKNGEVTVDRTSASKGTTVTITVDPDNGYELDELTVTDKNGDEIELIDKGNGKYTFKMPASKVTVDASFVETDSGSHVCPFDDVSTGDYYHDAVEWAVEQGITNGTAATMFSPNASCTRAQMVTFLWRAAGCPTPASSICAFTDLDSSAYYYTAVLWAVGEGVTNGTTATTFSPDAVVTRSQTVAFLWRYAGSTEMYGTVPYTDVPADAYYYDAVLWANENDITNGTTATTFSPDADCTRAQNVTFMYRYMGE